ncbi:MAG: hypothetical protein CM1200mP22_03370 [Dehalococcoidia bacterium]|nr:MAG: hypothetical protein CM1200mP22_03370 [Dehalococcoidia bacterium]
MDAIRLEWDNAILRVMTCNPDYLVMGMSSETFWGGLAKANELKAHMPGLTGLRAAMGSDACQAAIRCYGDIKKIGVLTPYWPVADQCQIILRRLRFRDCSPEGSLLPWAAEIAQTTEKEMMDSLKELNESDAKILVQVGTNLGMARMAAEAEKWLNKP